MTTANTKLQSAPLLARQAFLSRLVASGAITPFQADWIEAVWPNLDADAFTHPYLQTVREHTHFYLELAAQGDRQGSAVKEA